jgi:hypothetical protein
VAVFLLTAGASPVGAVTIGQLAPGTSPAELCTNPAPFDELQATVTSGNSYVVPALPPASALVLTSWSHNAGPSTGRDLTMKIFRKVAEPATYQVVAHDGPRALNPSTVNTFSGLRIPVNPGDVLGDNDGTTTNACLFQVPGEMGWFSRNGNLADGASGAFFSSPDVRLNMTAVVEPNNAFTLGGTTRNKKKGTATITATVPNPGELTASGNGVKSAGARTSVTVGAGTAQLTIRAQGKKKKKLKRKGKTQLAPTITYTPTGGTATSQSTQVKLKKKLLKKKLKKR